MRNDVRTNTGTVIIVDDDAPPWVFDQVWTECRGYCKCTKNDTTVILHRVIMGAKKGQIVDHINGDPRDCRRINLRFATATQNAWNMKCGGVTCVDGYWQVAIRVKGVNKYLGRYKTFSEARAVRIAAEKDRSAEFVRVWESMTEDDYWRNRRVKPASGEKPWEKRVRVPMKGSANGNSRYSEEAVKHFKAMTAQGVAVADAARDAGISASMGYHIANGKAWAWL